MMGEYFKTVVQISGFMKLHLKAPKSYISMMKNILRVALQEKYIKRGEQIYIV